MKTFWLPVLLAAAIVFPSCSRTRDREDALAWSPEERPYLQDAVETATWLRSRAVAVDSTLAWPVDARNPAEVSCGLGTGSAGVVLFFLELHRITGDPAYGAIARQGADYLLAALPESLAAGGLNRAPSANGLYGGWAGTGFVLGRAYETLGDPAYRTGALACVRLLERSAAAEGDGVAWNDADDLLDGSAGTGLFLIYAARTLDDPPALALAEAAARGLIHRVRYDWDREALTWNDPPGGAATRPNFAHGTAGIGCFLATLYAATRNQEYLSYALSAAEYLKRIARTDDDAVFLVPYDLPGDGKEERQVTGWADGPAGTARFLYRLALVTGDPQWTELMDKSAAGIRSVEAPNALGRRSGAAGVASFFLRLYVNNGDDSMLAEARSLAETVLAAAERNEEGLHWVASSGDAPAAAFTGFLDGAAGFGLLFLQLDAALNMQDWTLTFPDDPLGIFIEF